MPIWFVIYSIQHMSNGVGIKRVHYAIPTTYEEADTVYQNYRHLIYNPNINPHWQCEYFARDNTSFAGRVAEKKEQATQTKEAVAYSDWKDWE